MIRKNKDYKFRVYNWHSEKIEPLDNEDVGMVLDGADGLDIMQWTGLKDINGKDIYEGDLVKVTCLEANQWTGEVIFKDGEFVLNNSEDAEIFLNPEFVEVIGNIFENKDLIK